MRDIIALLRTLVLPAGATSGQRIVLDGDNGRIDVYDSSNNLIIRIYPSGIEIRDTSGDLRGRLASSADGYSTLTLFTASPDEVNGAKVAAISSEDGSGGAVTDYDVLSLTSSDSGLGLIRVLLLSPRSATKNPLFQIDTGNLDSSGVATPLIDLTGFTGARQAQVVAADYRMGSSNGGANAPTVGKGIPRGIMDSARITSSVTGFTTEADITGLSVTWTAVSGRYYKITCTGRGMTKDTAIGNMRAAITDSSNNHVAECDVRVDAVSNIGGVVAMQYTIPGTASGSVTYKVRGAVLTGGGTGTYASISELTVEDIGTL